MGEEQILSLSSISSERGGERGLKAREGRDGVGQRGVLRGEKEERPKGHVLQVLQEGSHGDYSSEAVALGNKRWRLKKTRYRRAGISEGVENQVAIGRKGAIGREREWAGLLGCSVSLVS